jgi:HJR/Mrr/RecB family endonuclease
VAYYRADVGCVITNSTFTRSAKALAQKSHVEPIDGAKLKEIMNRVRVE